MAVAEVSPQQVFARISHETGLLGDTYKKRRSPALLSTALCGIRSDRLDHSHLVLAVRFPDYDPDVLMRALHERRTLVRTWGVRGALQTVPTAQLDLYLAAAGIGAPRWRRFLDSRSSLSPAARLRLLKRLCPETLSRDSLREAIPDSTTRMFMLREAAQAGHIVWRDGDGQQASFVWTEAWLGHAVEPQHHYHDLVSRYLTSYGPLQAGDLAAWLGVTVAAARKLMAKHLVDEVQVDGESDPSFMKPEDLATLLATRKSRAKGLVIVPPGDPLLLAYRNRYHMQEEGGEEEGVVFMDGRPAAAWSLSRGVVSIRILDSESGQDIEKAVRRAVERAGIEAELEKAEP